MAETAGGIYYPTKEDNFDLENDLPKMSESVEARLTATKGKLLIAQNTGAALWKTLKGDATLSEDGTLTVANNSLLPVGVILAAAVSAAPVGFHLCDGAELSRITDAELFAVIGTTYGVGDGSTTYNVPDLRGRVPVGVDGAAGRLSANDALGNSAGEQTHTLSVGEMPAHSHPYDYALLTQGIETGLPRPAQGNTQPSTYNTRSTGGGGAHNNMQPYQVVNYIIKT